MVILLLILLPLLMYLFLGDIGKVLVLVTIGVLLNPFVLFVLYVSYRLMTTGSNK